MLYEVTVYNRHNHLTRYILTRVYDPQVTARRLARFESAGFRVVATPMTYAE